jgi:hypothetical protein
MLGKFVHKALSHCLAVLGQEDYCGNYVVSLRNLLLVSKITANKHELGLC